MIKELGKLCGQVFNIIKRNFKMGEWVERMTAVLMGAVSLLCFSMLGWEYGVVILAIALIDPRWFDE
jgi:hypothetical protein